MAPGKIDEITGPAVSAASTKALAELTEDWEDTIEFYLNGTRVVLENPDPETTLLEYLRGIGLVGVKLGCAEGGCGACTVVVSYVNPTTGKIYHASTNACLAPLISIDGKAVITVEGIGNVKNPHPAQERIAKGNGSQCGFCTPGIVMSLYALLRNNPNPTAHELESEFDGNLCRCTGYRPILDAVHTFSNEKGCSKSKENGGEGCCMESNGSGCCKSSEGQDDQPIKRFTPPGFIEYNPDTQLIFPPKLHKYEFKSLAFGNKRKRWYRPTSVEELLQIKSLFPSAKIIGGSTETQIEVKFKSINYSVSVYAGDIAELKQWSFKDDFVEIGANVTLTSLESIMEDAEEKYGKRKGQPFAAIKKQLLYFAGRQIRNVGTPAGNLATASPISDLNPVFVATNSILVVQSLNEKNEIPMSSFFKGYRVTALPPDAIITSIRIPVAKESNEFLRAFKQAKRKDDDIAIVNAALRVSLSETLNVDSIDLVYGGMAPTTIAAKEAQNYLKGKQWTHPKTLEGAFEALERDFDLRFGVPGGMATYRKTLALSFFYKFYHETLLELDSQEVKADTEAIGEIERMISTGKRDLDSAAKYQQKFVGKDQPHASAMKHCTGEAQYLDDIPVQKNELYGHLVLSTKAHARIVSVDPSAALQARGVVAFIDHKDLPNEKSNWWGAPICDEVFLAVDEVFTAGQPIGMIVADSAHNAEVAARLVKTVYEELPAIFTIEEAIEKESYFQHFREIKNGSPEEAFEEADHVFSGIVRMGGQEHFYLETQASLAIPKEDGEMEVWSSTQNCAETQSYVAQVLNTTANKIVAKTKRLGGGFGGKETRSVQLSCICAVAAHRTKRPVRCMLNRDQDIETSGQRHPFLARWKIAVNKDGKLQALDADVFANAGHTQDLSGAVVERSLSHIDGVYKFPNIHVRGRLAKTNTVSNTAFRGFGGPQGMFIIESAMSEVADHLNMPVETLRQINMYESGQTTHFNQELRDWFVPLMYKQVLEESDYSARRKEIEEFNKTSKWNKRGLSLIGTKFGISFTALWLNQAGALVHIYPHDGSVLVAHGGIEMGNGLHTKMISIAAEALNISPDQIIISETATNTVANASSTAASASSDLNGYAIWNACKELNERLAPYREKLGEKASMKELSHAAYFDRVNLTAQGFYKTPEIGYVWGENTGKMFYYFTQGVAAAEVEISTLTGDWTCRRVDIKMDVGHSINPAIDYGQIEGAFVQGQGLFTTEESLWHRASGQIFTKGPGTYKIPGFRDIPQIMNVSLLKDVEWENLRTIQRSRGVGEPPLFLGSAVFFAIRDALKSARKEWGCDEVLSLRSPATVERIRLSCKDPLVERARVQPTEGEKSFFISI